MSSVYMRVELAGGVQITVEKEFDVEAFQVQGYYQDTVATYEEPADAAAKAVGEVSAVVAKAVAR